MHGIKTDIELQADWGDIPESQEEEKDEPGDTKKCMNCKKMIKVDDYQTHTIMCFRYKVFFFLTF